MAAAPKRSASLSQFWLPFLLFVLSVVSILFTLRNDKIPVIGPTERAIIASSDLETHRQMINQALQASASWRTWCEKRAEALASLRFANFDQDVDASRWTSLRRFVPQREQDAWLRCQNAERLTKGPMHACLLLNAKDKGKDASTQTSLHLIELTLELRALGRKKFLSCSEALTAGQPVELAVWYTYYALKDSRKKPLHFEHLTGGTRIFPPLAQNAKRSAVGSQP